MLDSKFQIALQLHSAVTAGTRLVRDLLDDERNAVDFRTDEYVGELDRQKN